VIRGSKSGHHHSSKIRLIAVLVTSSLVRNVLALSASGFLRKIYNCTIPPPFPSSHSLSLPSPSPLPLRSAPSFCGGPGYHPRKNFWNCTNFCLQLHKMFYNCTVHNCTLKKPCSAYWLHKHRLISHSCIYERMGESAAYTSIDAILLVFLSVLGLPRVGFGAHVCYYCGISPPRFLAECRKRRLNQGSLVFLYFNSSALFDLYLVFACLFSCTALFVSISQVIGCEDRLRNDRVGR